MPCLFADVVEDVLKCLFRLRVAFVRSAKNDAVFAIAFCLVASDAKRTVRRFKFDVTAQQS